MTTISRLESATAPGRVGDAATPLRAHMLVWVGNNVHAQSLVRRAGQLAAATSMSWTVIAVETQRTLHQFPWQRAHVLRALELAESLGASTDSVHADSVLDGVVERARADRATVVLIGGAESQAWFDRWRRHWLGGLAEALGDQLPDATIHAINFPQAHAAASPVPAQAVREQLPRWVWLRALAVVAACTLACDLLLPSLELVDVAMVYLTGVVFVALRYGRSASTLAVVLSILVFDLIFVPPRWGFHPLEPKYFFTFGVMLVVGLLIGRLVDQARLQALVAQGRARRAQALNDLARHLATARSEQAVADGLASVIRSTFAAEPTLWQAGADGQLRPVGDAAGAAEGGAADAPDEIARRVFEAGRSAGAGTEIAADATALYLPMKGSNGTLGVLRVEPLPLRFGAAEDRHLLQAFADQAAIALERSLYERRSTDAVVAAEAERLRNTLLSGISHDFRTPLTAIIGSATTLLQQGAALGEQRCERLLQGILDEARRMHSGMSDILDLTRMEEGFVQPVCEWCPADELVEEVREAVATRLRQHVLEVHVAPETVVWCDARLVQQALVNLIDNAVCHTPPHTRIEVGIDATSEHWCLSVVDNGPGVPTGREAQVFKKFVRGRGEPTRTGTGLGLAICAAVARLHRGSITAANEAGGGARFTLTLPQPAAHRLPLDEAA